MMMAIRFYRQRVFIALRHQFRSYLKSNPSIARNPNPNPKSFPFSINPLNATCPFSFNSPPLNLNQSSSGVRGFATRLAESNNRPPKDTILLEGCDFQHWLVVVEDPDSQFTRDEIIDGYVKTLTHVFQSQEEARMKIYSVSTRHYFAFGALVSEELAYRLKELPHVRWVLPDSYLDVKNKTYAGEPFINGQAVPYDPKYHEMWVFNHEQSLKNNMKNKRKQRDPNSARPRSRSPQSATQRGPNQNWVPAAGVQNQAPLSSTVQNHIPQSAPSSNPNVASQNWMPSSSAQVLKPSPPLSSQRQVPRLTQMQNPTLPSTPQSQSSATMDPNCQNWGNQNQSWTPVGGSENHAWQSSQLQEQTPPSLTSKSCSSQFSGQNQSWGPASGFQNQSPPPPMTNNEYSYDKFPPSAAGSGMPSRLSVPDFQGGRMPPQVQPNNNYRNIPQHVQNNISQSGYSHPPEPLNYQKYQNSYRNLQNSNAMVPSPRNWNPQNTDFPPATPARDAQYDMLNPGFHRGDMTFAHQQNVDSYRGFTSDVQNGNSHKTNLSMVSNPQQTQSYRDMQSSNAMVSPHPEGVLNYPSGNITPSAVPRVTSSSIHDEDFHRESIPSQTQVNGGSQSHNGYPSRTSPHQQYQNTVPHFHSSNASGPPSCWKHQNMITPMHDNSVCRSNLPPHVQNQFHGADTSKQMPNHGYQSNIGLAAQEVDNGSGALPSNVYQGSVQTRDYQERDLPTDDE